MPHGRDALLHEYLVESYAFDNKGEILIASVFLNGHDYLGGVNLYISFPGDSFPLVISGAWHPVFSRAGDRLYYSRTISWNGPDTVARSLGRLKDQYNSSRNAQEIDDIVSQHERVCNSEIDPWVRAVSDSIGVSPSFAYSTNYSRSEEDLPCEMRVSIVEFLDLHTRERSLVRGIAGHPIYMFRSGKLLVSPSPWIHDYIRNENPDRVFWIYSTDSEVAIPVKEPFTRGSDPDQIAPLLGDSQETSSRARDGRRFYIDQNHNLRFSSSGSR